MQNKKIAVERYVVYNRCFGGFGLSLEACEWLRSRGLEFELAYDVCRHDQLLALCVMTLGSEKASGSSAKLAVHELLGDRYIIDEYDGRENVVEPGDIIWTILE